MDNPRISLTFLVLLLDLPLNLLGLLLLCLFEPVVLVRDRTEHHQVDRRVHEDDYNVQSEEHLRQEGDFGLPSRVDVVLAVEPKLVKELLGVLAIERLVIHREKGEQKHPDFKKRYHEGYYGVPTDLHT